MSREVYIKFGKYHGQKGVVVGVSLKNNNPIYYIQMPDSNIIMKKQRNTIFLAN